jgi:23S rRNA (guanosine2251-2'-O)-methyltransferase
MPRRHNERFRGRDELTIYGRRAVIEALSAPAVEVLAVAAVKSLPPAVREELAAACDARSITPDIRTIAQINDLSGDPRHDQGIAARIRLANIDDVGGFLERARAAPPSELLRLIALDSVTNPQNVGMIVRSAAAAGMNAILWPTQGSPWVNGLIIKASAASIYRTRIVRTHTLADGLIALRAAGFRLVGLTMTNGRDLFTYSPPPRTVFIVGHETEGLSRDIESLLDDRLTIPMHAGVESLNAAVAASILCFYVTRHPR